MIIYHFFNNCASNKKKLIISLEIVLPMSCIQGNFQGIEYKLSRVGVYASNLSLSKLSIPFCFIRNDWNIPYQFKKRNKIKQISSHFKSQSVSDLSAKFRPERSSFIPHVPFRSWKAIESNWTLFNLIN